MSAIPTANPYAVHEVRRLAPQHLRQLRQHPRTDLAIPAHVAVELADRLADLVGYLQIREFGGIALEAYPGPHRFVESIGRGAGAGLGLDHVIRVFLFWVQGGR